VHETNTETNDANITYIEDPVDNPTVLSYTSMDGSEHEKDYDIGEMRLSTFHSTLA
jgi:hypothetical protein